MLGFRIPGVALLAAVMMSAAPAVAAPIIYTLNGRFGGTIEGRDFADTALTFTGIGNTDAVFGDDGFSIAFLSAFSAFDGKRTYTFTDGNALAFADDATVVPINFDAGGFFAFTLPRAYGGRTTLAATEATFLDGNMRPFDGADFTGGSITSGSGLSFSAMVQAVPEPASWAMMIAGFGLAGAALRRRNSLRVSWAQ